MIGLAKIQELMELCERVVDEDAEDPQLAILGSAMLVVEVKDLARDQNAFFCFCSDKRNWVQRAMLREATEIVEESLLPSLEEDDGD